MGVPRSAQTVFLAPATASFMKFQALTLRMLAACVLFIGLFSTAQAQERKSADKIIAIVGKNRIILQSELDEQSQQMAAQQYNGVPLTDSMRCLLLQEMITTKMLVEQAERDSLLVSDEEVDANLDNRIRYFTSLYGGREKMEQQTGKTVHQMKEEYRDIFREQMMADKVKSKLLENVRVTPAEVQAFFNRQAKDSLPFYPATVEVGEVVVDPITNPELDKYAREKLEDIRKQIVTDGKSFETMAGLYSEDPGSRDNGGLYTDVSRNGGFATEFISAAFRLQNGEVSPVVRTQFGYHIIQMVKRKGDQVDVRHILIMPQHTSEDYKAAMARLDSVRAQIIAGKLNFAEAVTKYSTDQNAKMTGGMMTDQRTGSNQLPIDQLDPALALMIDSLKPGSISQPQQFKTARGELSCRIVYLRSRTDPHQANLKDDYSKIQAVAKQQKEYDRLQNWIAERLPTYYLKVDPDFQHCSNLTHWLEVTSRQ
jgi:peptidyl-prolyl cis-trans isomerase SurA